MKIELLDCGKWAVVNNGHIVGGLTFDTCQEAQEFLYILSVLP